MFFANNIETRRFLQSFIISLFRRLVIWKLAKQNTIIISITEAELLSLFLIAKETIILKRLF